MSVRSPFVAAMVVLFMGACMDDSVVSAEEDEPAGTGSLSSLLISSREAPRFELVRSNFPLGVAFHSDGRVSVRLVRDAHLFPPQAFTDPGVVNFGALKQVVVPSESQRLEHETTRVRYYEDNEIQYETTVSNDLLNYILADVPARFSMFHGEQMKSFIQSAAERHGHDWWAQALPR